MSDWSIEPVTADTPSALDDVRALFEEYAEWLWPVLESNRLPAELRTLPDPFAPPTGALLLARDAEDAACGCVGVQRHDEAACEIKRLYVRPRCRGRGIGAALFSAALDAARGLGYSIAYVSTIPSAMPGANRMYDALGFREVESFEDHAHEGVDMRFLRLDLL